MTTLAANMGTLDWIAAVGTAGCAVWFVAGAIVAGMGNKSLLKPLASLKFTVVLFALSLVLIFVGTLAQVDAGIWTILSKYFRTWVADVEMQGLIRFGQTFFGTSKDAVSETTLPFPGGYLLGWLMMLNLLAAHAIRFKLNWNRGGVICLHVGIILMLVGELVTAMFAVESQMTIYEDQTVNFSQDIRSTELAVVRSIDDENEHVVTVPKHMLEDGATIDHDDLPFKIEVVQFMTNSAALSAQEAMAEGIDPTKQPGDSGLALQYIAIEQGEFAGVGSEASAVDVPSIYVKLIGKDGKSMGTYLLSHWFSAANPPMPQVVEVDDVKYELWLRFERYYYPFALTLTDFDNGYYPGTEKPRHFHSTCQLVDPTTGENRQVEIYMNHPLRYAGLTFFQSNWIRGGHGTILQVVRNPGWLLPYISCVVVAVGMCWHFGIMLNRFARRSKPS